jgi:RND family efflux transporter MFP subunit
MTAAPDLRSLTGPAPRGDTAPVPRPPRRWATRLGLPIAVLLIAGGLLAYAARAALWPRTDVWVVPVVAKPGAAPTPGQPATAAGHRGAITQAPGWVEPDPYAVTVPALTDGVVKEVLVLEGQQVEKDQVVVRLIDEDARLAAERAEAELAAMQADASKARADLDAATARAAEVRDEVTRKRELVNSGGISTGQFARLQLRGVAADKEVDAAHAALALADANVNRHRVVCAEARLALSRTEIRSPAPGIVLARLVEPGSRISMSRAGGSAAEPMTGAVLRLYDAKHLQVRADVPLADAAKVAIGTPAEVTTEALPGKTFTGSVTRLVHEADIQRNTVQVKVRIDNTDLASGALRPEMLTRVRFFASGSSNQSPSSTTTAASSAGELQLLIPAAAPFKMMGADMAHVWIADQSAARGAAGPVASERQLTVAQAPGDQLLVLAGLNPGDRVIVDPPASLKEGSRIRILGEKPASSEPSSPAPTAPTAPTPSASHH